MRSLFVYIGCVLIAFKASGQVVRKMYNQKAASTDKFWSPEKIIVGGNLGPLYFSGYQNVVGISVLSGYRVTENFWPGINLGYINYSEKVSVFNGIKPEVVNYAINTVNTGIFARYKLLNFIMPSVELERNWMIEKLPYYSAATQKIEKQKTTYGNNSLLVGGGLYRGSDHQGSYILLLYDLLYNNTKISPYGGHMTLKAGIMVSDVFGKKKKN